MTIPNKTVLDPGETMRGRKRKERDQLDMAKVADVVSRNPGVPSKAEIAAKTGLTIARVALMIRKIKDSETHVWIDYGERKPVGGPYAGTLRRGWFPMSRKAYHPVLDQADEHEAKVQIGVHRGRLIRYGRGQGIRNADEVIRSIEERLGLTVEQMSPKDIEAFEELLAEEAISTT